VDYDGSETYTLAVKNILTGEILPDVVDEISGDVRFNLI
jgi:protease II